MDCPDLETLGLHLDRALGHPATYAQGGRGGPPDPPAFAEGGPPELPPPSAIDEHLRACPDCMTDLEALRELGAALEEQGTWKALEERAATCLRFEDLVRLVGGAHDAQLRGAEAASPTPPEHVHLRACARCRDDVAALREAVAEHDRGEAAVAPTLRERLRRIAPADASTAEELDAARGLAVRRGSGSGARRVGSDRLVGTSSRSRRRSTGTRGTSSQRRRTGRASPLGRQPVWAWSVLAAAAALLVAVALALSSGNGRDGRDVAFAPPPPPPAPAPRVPLVSDRTTGDRTGAGAPPPTPRVPDRDADPTYPDVEPEPAPPSPESTELTTNDRPPSPGTDPPTSQGPAGGPAPDPDPIARGDRDPTTTRERSRPAADPPPIVSPPPAPDRLRVVEDGGELQVALAHLGGSVALLGRDGAARTLAPGPGTAVLQPGDRLRSRTGGFVALEDGAFELCLDEGTDVVVVAAERGPVLGVERGRVLADVAPLAPGRRFEVRTAQATFSCLGTVFAVEAGERAAGLLVAEGTVAAENALGRVEVGAGLSTVVDALAAPPTPAALDARALAWTRAWAPRRQAVYEVRFDDRLLAGFAGELCELNATPGPGLSLLLAPTPGNRYWGLTVAAPRNRIHALRAAPDTYLQLSVFSERATPVLVQLLNESQNKEFKAGFTVAAGRWSTLRVALMDLKTYFDPGLNPVREGDMFVDLEVYAAEPGQTFRVAIDDVQVFRKVYR